MKKIIILLLALVICFYGFAGCDEPKGTDDKGYKIESPSDTTNKDKSDSSDLGKEEQDEEEIENAGETKQEDQETEKEDKNETGQGSWSKDVQI